MSSSPLQLHAATIRFDGGVVRVSVWTCRGSRSVVTQDDWLVENFVDDRLRIAVIDGVTPWKSEHPAGADAAVWAAGVVRTAARDPQRPEVVLRRAHDTLWRPDLLPSRRRPSASAAICDITFPLNAMTVTAAAASDCEAWVQSSSGWSQIAGGDALHPDWRAAWERRKRAHPEWDDEQRIEAEATFLDDVTCRPHPAVGRQQELHLTTGHAVGCTSVVCATDGARLTPAALGDIESHLTRVTQQSHGDITVIHAVCQR